MDFVYSRKRIRKDRHLIFSAAAGASDNKFRDNISGTDFAQVYAGTNRTRINSAGLLEAVAANIPVIDYVSGMPMLRIEGQAANLLFSPNTFTAGAGWTLDNVTTEKNIVGADGVANSGTTLTGTGLQRSVYKSISKSTADATTYFNVSVYFKKTTSASIHPRISLAFGGTSARSARYYLNTNTGAFTADIESAGNIGKIAADKGDWWHASVWAQDNAANSLASIYIYSPDNGSVGIDNAMITTGAIPSSWFAGAAAIGAELVTDGGFDAVTQGAAVNSGLLTVGNCYKIASRTDGDFIAAGAPDNNVGTYFNATTTGVGLLDAGDTVNPITFTSWTCTNSAAPQALAGVLTGKLRFDSSIAGTASQTILTANKVYRGSYVIDSISVGAARQQFGNLTPTANSAAGTFNEYGIADGTTYTIRSHTSTDAVVSSASIKEHGTVRASEAGTITATTSAKMLAALAAVGTMAIKIRFPYAKAGVTAATNIFTPSNSATGFLYHTAAGVFTLSDGTNTATNDDAFIANTDYYIVPRWGKAGAKMDLGFGIPGSISFDAEANFDGAMTTTGGLTYLFHSIGQGGGYIQKILAWDEAKGDAYLNALK